jgi:CheY-like chemotaxis protein
MTADVYEEVRRRCLAGGIDGVLTKPIFIHQLLETLTRWLP